MQSIFVDPPSSQRRELLYAGNLMILTRVDAVMDFVALARSELTKAFAPHDPEYGHLHYNDEQLERIVGPWKATVQCTPTLTKEIICQAGFDPATTYYSMPRARSSYPLGHIQTGVAQAFPWHRDVWYATPPQQINWWFPIFDVAADNGLSFDLSSFSRPVDNDSSTFDHGRESTKPRLEQTTSATAGALSLPGAAAWEAPLDTVILPRPGQIILFSGAQLHRTIPNTSAKARYSMDFRTVDCGDVESGAGAPLVDVECKGTALGMFRSVADEAPFPEGIIHTVEERQQLA